jgi:hypothetical protein
MIYYLNFNARTFYVHWYINTSRILCPKNSLAMKNATDMIDSKPIAARRLIAVFPKCKRYYFSSPFMIFTGRKAKMLFYSSVPRTTHSINNIIIFPTTKLIDPVFV